MLTNEEAIERLHQAVEQAGSQRAFAKQHGLTAGYVNDVLNERRALANRIARTIGLRREMKTIIGYQEIEDA